MRESCVLSNLGGVWHGNPAFFAENQAAGTRSQYSPAEKFPKENVGWQPKLPSGRASR
jgi:hypothetical protein